MYTLCTVSMCSVFHSHTQFWSWVENLKRSNVLTCYFEHAVTEIKMIDRWYSVDVKNSSLMHFVLLSPTFRSLSTCLGVCVAIFAHFFTVLCCWYRWLFLIKVLVRANWWIEEFFKWLSLWSATSQIEKLNLCWIE